MGSMLQYGSLAKYYDMIYSFKDYEKESRIIATLANRYKKSTGNELLDVGCGTGKHIVYLKKWFACTGIDKSEDMLRFARRQVDGVRFVRGDMARFEMRKKFDVIVSLFSVIGYTETHQNLALALNNLSRHLKSGGVLIIEPWFTKAAWKSGSVHMHTYGTNDVKIARVGFSGTDGSVSVLDEHYLIAEKGKGIKHFRDVQRLGLFGRAETLALMRAAGLRAMYAKRSLAPGRGLYIGVKERDLDPA